MTTTRKKRFRATYIVHKGVETIINTLLCIPKTGVISVWRNPRNAGINVVEIIMEESDPDELPTTVKNHTADEVHIELLSAIRTPACILLAFLMLLFGSTAQASIIVNGTTTHDYWPAIAYPYYDFADIGDPLTLTIPDYNTVSEITALGLSTPFIGTLQIGDFTATKHWTYSGGDSTIWSPRTSVALYKNGWWDWDIEAGEVAGRVTSVQENAHFPEPNSLAVCLVLALLFATRRHRKEIA